MDTPPPLKYPLDPPTPANYQAWYQARIDRTIEAMRTQKRIPGFVVRRDNLSMKVLYDNGYTLDQQTDTMVKE